MKYIILFSKEYIKNYWEESQNLIFAQKLGNLQIYI